MRWVVALGMLLVVWLPWSAAADGGMERQFTDLVHRERSAAGVAAYAEKGDLADVARRQAQRMASEGRLYHNPRLGDDVQNWDAVGENVGRGPSVDAIHQAFMDSPSHRSEILSRTFTEVGVGVAIASDGEIWVAQVFRKPTAQQQPAPAPTTAPTTTARPAPMPPPSTTAPTSARVAPAIATPTTTAPAPTTSTTSTTVTPPPPPPPPPVTPEVLAAVEAPSAPTAAAQPQPVLLARAASGDAEVSGAVRVAATLLVLVVAAQTTYVAKQTERPRRAAASSPRRRLAASAATLP